MTRRDEEKKQRRQKRLEKRQKHQRPDPVLDPLRDQLRRLDELMRTAPPATYPGGCDPSLDRPDMLKLELATRATEQEPGRTKIKQMEDAARHGLLADIPGLADHWVVEEFLWHGVPGDSWHPLDAALDQIAGKFPPAAVEQLRLWKLAEIGLFEIGDIHDDTVTLDAWDPIQETHTSQPLRAIALNIGGVNVFRQSKGSVTLTYLAPWSLADNLYCSMGYSKTVPKSDVALAAPYLGLQHPDIVCRPLPWNVKRSAANEYLREWRGREWQGWLGERLRFPFWAVPPMPPNRVFKVVPVLQLLPSTPQRAQHFGIYLDIPNGEEMLAAGATAVIPLDVASANALPLAEYRAYRKIVGPPPGTIGMTTWTETP